MKKINMTGKRTAIAAMALCAVMAVGGAMAYFTDVDSAKNTIEIGNVKIDLTEPKWDSTPDTNSNGIPDTAEKIVPGKTIPKDPTVTNTGKNDAYIYLKVTIPTANIITANEDGTLANNGKAVETELFSLNNIDSNWQLMGIVAVPGRSEICYGYKSIVKPGEKTTALFDSVTFVNAIEGQGLEDNTYDIDVKASAIQSDETGSLEEAFEKYMNQNA